MMPMKRAKKATDEAIRASTAEPHRATGRLASPGRIAARAFELYLARGGEPGQDLEDWLRAEAELRGDENG